MLIVLALLTFIVLYVNYSNQELDIYAPIGKFISDTSRNAITLKCFEASRYMRIVRVIPFDWYIINENNAIFFMLDNGIGSNCSFNYSPAIIYYSMADVETEKTKVQCITPSLDQIESFTRSLKYEQISYEPKSNKVNQNHAKDLIIYLLEQGIFTFSEQTTSTK